MYLSQYFLLTQSYTQKNAIYTYMCTIKWKQAHPLADWLWYGYAIPRLDSAPPPSCPTATLPKSDMAARAICYTPPLNLSKLTPSTSNDPTFWTVNCTSYTNNTLSHKHSLVYWWLSGLCNRMTLCTDLSITGWSSKRFDWDVLDPCLIFTFLTSPSWLWTASTIFPRGHSLLGMDTSFINTMSSILKFGFASTHFWRVCSDCTYSFFHLSQNSEAMPCTLLQRFGCKRRIHQILQEVEVLTMTWAWEAC